MLFTVESETFMFPRTMLLVVCFLSILSACAGKGVSIPLASGRDVSAITGNFVVPQGSGPFPTVVIVHGCAGQRKNGAMWADYLASQGFASVELDGFGPRGVNEVCTDFSRVPVARRIMDLKDVLVFLASQPSVAIDRVAIMGFSNGAVVVLDTASSFWSQQVAVGKLRFRGAIALYPECKNRLVEYAMPALILIGESDDWTLAKSCETLLERITPESVRPELRIYPGSHHAFDVIGAGAYLPNVRNMNSHTGFGATVAWDSGALESAKEDVLRFLRSVLK